jgi:hypothetical protein
MTPMTTAVELSKRSDCPMIFASPPNVFLPQLVRDHDDVLAAGPALRRGANVHA